jgi:uncharacterized protein (TIGR02265 family)
MADRYVYAVAVESFFLGAMGGRLDAPVRAALREVGLALEEPLLSVYPSVVFHRAVAIAAAAVYPGRSPDDAQHLAGRDHVDAFVRSYPGKMMAALARQIEPRTILQYTSTFVRLGNNFTESRARVLGPARVEVWMNDVCDVPGWYRGILERGMEIADVKGVRVAAVPGTAPPAATYEVTWTGR